MRSFIRSALMIGMLGSLGPEQPDAGGNAVQGEPGPQANAGAPMAAQSS